MANIENLPPPIADHRVANVRHFEAGPPEGLQLVCNDGETIATTKEEEWISKKKTEVTNTKQIETRVKRQVVLEDGKIIEDSGPLVTTNTTEDTETQEHHQSELRKLGDGDNNDNNNNNNNDSGSDKEKKIEISDNSTNDNKEKWISVPNPDGVVREVQEKRIVSHEEIEEIKETEDVQHYGDITDEDFLAAVHSGRDDLRQVLKTVDSDGRKIVSTGPRLIRDTIKSNKVIDTENLKESSSVRPDGKIVTESQRTTEHEEIYDDELPDELNNQEIVDTHKENHQRFLKVREQEDVDYISDGKKIGHEMKYKTETTEMERYGDDDLKHNGIDETDFDRFSQRLKKQQQQRRYNTNMLLTTPTTTTPLDRTDVLTRKPLDFDQEEEARKVETSKWLEHHFGSESRSSNDNYDDDHDTIDVTNKKQLPPKTSFFNVTIKSSPIRDTPSPIRQPEYQPTTVQQTTTTTTANYKGISQWSSTPPPPPTIQRQHSPIPDYDNDNDERIITTPIPPQRKQRQRQQPEPPPDYSPPRNPTPPIKQQIVQNKTNDKKTTRFAPITTTTSTQTKPKSGNIIGQSIRKLVGKIRSASSERKNAKQRNGSSSKRSSSPSYQKGHVIDDNHINRYHHSQQQQQQQPVQRYYLGEDPFAGSIYGRENKYDGVKPRKIIDNDYRSQSTLGRFSKSTTGLVNSNTTDQNQRFSQTLPRRPHQHPKYYKYETPTRLEKSTDNNDNTINVSIINTISTPPPPASILKSEPPAKPARTYRSNLSRSQSFNIHQSDNLKRINNGIDLKSPGLISILSRSQRDLNETIDQQQQQPDRRKRIFLKGLQDRAPELYRTLQENDIHEPPTRLKDHHLHPHQHQSIIRRNSGASSTDYSEMYHTTTHNNDPYQPTVTNTITSYTKKTLPNNRNLTETIESKEIKSVTKRFNSTSSSPTTVRTSPSPVVIEVRNNNNYYK